MKHDTDEVLLYSYNSISFVFRKSLTPKYLLKFFRQPNIVTKRLRSFQIVKYIRTHIFFCIRLNTKIEEQRTTTEVCHVRPSHQDKKYHQPKSWVILLQG